MAGSQDGTFVVIVKALPELLVALVGAVGLLLCMRSFAKTSPQTGGGKALVGGSWLYVAVQPLFILTLPIWSDATRETAETIGFSLGLGAKAAMIVAYVDAFASSAAGIQERAARLHSAEQTVAKISHELGTPIAEVMMYIESMNKAAPKAGLFRSSLVMLENAIHRIGAIVAASKDVPLLESAISMGRGDLIGPADGEKRQVVAINALVETALMAVKRTRAEIVTFSISYAANAFVECVPFQMIQVFVNLLRNAYDALPVGEGQIWIQTSTKTEGARAVVVEIRDDGEGLSEDVRKALWQDGMTTRSGPGRGHGLSVVKRLVESNRGEVSLEGNADGERGCRAVVTLPKAPKMPQREGHAS